jgi:glucoamylase
MAFAKHYLATGNETAKDRLYDSRLPSQSVIKNDLEYIANNWHGIGFDLWEEVRIWTVRLDNVPLADIDDNKVSGMHFFTLLVSLRALKEGTWRAASWVQQQLHPMHKKAHTFLFPFARCRVR